MPTIHPLAIPEVMLITPRRHGDDRGWFSETWSRRVMLDAGLDLDFIQDNQAFNARSGTVRGLHFQKTPHAQTKLVRVLAGSVFDVAVDLRANSPTLGQWVGARLTAEGGEQLLIPRGFAHGYCTLEDATMLAYKVDGDYAPQAEAGVLWNDPELAIDWPVAADAVILSDKDLRLPRLRDLAALGA